MTIAHEVLVTVTVDLRRVAPPRATSRSWRRRSRRWPTRRGCSSARLEAAGLTRRPPLSPLELSTAIRLRSDPGRGRPGQLGALRRSLAAATGRGTIEWGPMAVEVDWFDARVDGSVHRSYRMASLADAAGGRRLAGPAADRPTAATRTVTVVLEPVPLARAAADANRQLTSIEGPITPRRSATGSG